MTPVRWGMAAVPVGGGAWPDNEPTRRAKLAARTAHGRVATHRHTQRPGTTGVEGAGGPVGLAAVPVGGGRAWPDNEPTRRAKLAARTAHGRAATHRHTQRPDTTGVEGTGGTGGPAAVPMGGGKASPGFEATRREKLAARTARGRVATHRHTQRPGTTGVEGAGGSGGHGRASRSTTPSRRLACGDLAGGRARRRPEHPWGHKQHSTGARARRPAPLDATTQTRQLRSTCVPSRSARAARRWMRSSRSLRLRRRAGPRR